MGWRPQDEQELFTLDELKEKFSIEGLGVSPAVLDLEKLDYLNGYYIRQKSLEGLRKLCYPYLSQEGLVNNETDKDFIEKVLLISRERLKRLEDIASLSFYLFRDDFVYEEELLIWKDLSLDQVKNNLKEIYQVIDSINENAWQIESLEKKILSYLKDKGYKNGDFLWPLRVALSGQKNSPSPFELLWALGKERSLKRIERAMI